MTAWRPTATPATLRARAALVARARAFFAERGVLEVDTPVLQGGANLDPGIAPVAVPIISGVRYLPTSPEHPLKRLVAARAGPVWTLAPAFRAGERGVRHQPEFRMLEWYRPGWDDLALRDEALALLQALVGSGPITVVRWRELFRERCGIDPLRDHDDAIRAALPSDAPRGLDAHAALDLLLATRIEPHLGRGGWCVVTDYPPWAAAQARLRTDTEGDTVAARFEIYRDGIELANGYWELDDASELERRLEAERAGRAQSVALDQRFAAAMRHGLGDCAGIAVGFDRVVMLALGLPEVAATMAFAWDVA